ncbi:MAG: SWIM zinc finger family protein [Woeseiaceae bacterium]
MTLSELTFQVKGSSTEPYDVTFIKDGDSLTALCSCPAGQFGNFCKHRIAILDGNGQAIVSENSDRVATVVDWLQGTDVAAALAEFRAIEKSSEEPKSSLVAAKRKLARAMNS